MRLPLTAFLLVTLSFAAAQPFNWQWSVSDTATLSSPDVMGFTTDALGNSYVAGQFYGTATFGALPPITSQGQSDVYVAKYDNQGVALWVTSAGGTDFDGPQDLAIDENGAIYITGYFQSPTADFGGNELDLVGNMDVFVAKLDAADGGFIWSQRYGSNDFQADHVEWGKAVACDDSGNVYVSGCFKYTLAVPGLPQLDGCSQYYNSFLMKLDTDGNGIWSRRPDCGQQWIYSASEGQVLTVGADDMLYAGFRIRGDTIFYETDTLLNSWSAAGTHEGVVAKYDLDGNYHWSRVIGGYGYDDVQGLQADAEGKLYVAMHREEQYNLGIPGIDVSGSLGIYRNVILKMDADGNFIWGTRLGNSTYDHDIEAMKLEDAGHLLVAGWHQGNFEIGGLTPNPGVNGNYGLWLARFDSSSALTDLHATRYQYPRGIRGLGLDEGGNIYIAGYFQDSLSLPGLPVMELGDDGSGAMFIARSGDFNTGGDTRHTVLNEATVYPNPSNGRITVQSTVTFNGVRITNVMGCVVMEAYFPRTTTRELEISGEGAYYYQLFDDGGRTIGGRILLIH